MSTPNRKLRREKLHTLLRMYKGRTVYVNHRVGANDMVVTNGLIEATLIDVIRSRGRDSRTKLLVKPLDARFNIRSVSTEEISTVIPDDYVLIDGVYHHPKNVAKPKPVKRSFWQRLLFWRKQ